MTDSFAATIQERLTALGPEFQIAMELPRLWATGAQIFVQNEITMLVLREQNNLVDDEGKVQNISVKNVGSYVLPTEAFRSLVNLANEQLALLDANGAG